MQLFLSDAPTVTLTKAFTTPFDNAIATARTCYSSKIVFDHDVSRDERAKELRDKIAQSTYMAGHHTTLQHAHFQFAISNVSRQSLWSFFHAHPFYNSEQVSQRYVPVKSGRYLIPTLANSNLQDIYRSCAERQLTAYKRLVELLHPVCEERYFEVYRGRRKNHQDKKWQADIKKRAQEVARYVLPLATFAHLYHTISGLTLHRYRRLCRSVDCPTEQTLIAEAMCAEVTKIDPDFFKYAEDSLPLQDTLEERVLQRLQLEPIDSRNAQALAREFDASLMGQTSKLTAITEGAERHLALAVRQSLGLCEESLSDHAAIATVLSPAHNHYRGESLNLLSLSKVARALMHVHISFNKKMSHAADCQAQRHRTLPSQKTIFSRTINLLEPDYITPTILLSHEAKEAKTLYDDVQEQTLNDIRTLHHQGVSSEWLQYLFTNAHPIRYTDSGSLADHMHRWTSRLCFNAQEEIWKTARDEVLQIRERAPLIGKYLLPPCGLRKLSEHTPLCPEGDRFCGVPVWKQEPETYHRLL